MNITDDLSKLLHPYDDRDIPVPSFVTGNAFIAWVREQPSEAVRAALLDVLREDGVPQQSMAVAALRALGVEVDANREHGFFWEVVRPDGSTFAIEPAHRP